VLFGLIAENSGR